MPLIAADRSRFEALERRRQKFPWTGSQRIKGADRGSGRAKAVDLIEIDGSCDSVARLRRRANKPSNVYNVRRGWMEEKDTLAGWQDVGVGVGSRLSLALTVRQSISSRGVEISAIDKRMNIVNNK